jgi:cyclophilin family peptidyl-prolyl cis-trans isomerase
MAWWKQSLRRSDGSPGTACRRSSRTVAEPTFLEPLEQRQLLAFNHTFLSNLPALTSLENQLDTVVRFQTNLGVFDIEMFDQTAPGTVANFLQYVRDGAYDQMFFHRLVSGFVLQGGGYKFRDAGGLSSITTRPPIQNEFQRLNVERTIAMAKIAGNLNSATSQFFFNLADNPGLNTPNGGLFTVFGKVISGWDVIQSIAALSVRDLDVALTGSPGLIFDDVPFKGSSTAAPSENTLVMVWDAEIIKPFGVKEFYTHAVYFPEGYRASNIVERVDLVNVDTLAPNRFQILVRYENGDRDQIVATGVLPAGARNSIKIADANLSNLNLVREGVGYAFEIRSTRVLAASLNHRDFGVTLGESFIAAAGLTTGGLSNWSFAAGEKGPGRQEFVLWENLTDQNITVNVAIYPQSQNPMNFSFVLERYRRGGVAVHSLVGVPDKPYSVRVSATGPIVAAMSRYFNQGTGPNGTHEGSTQGGVILGGRSEGYLAAARLPTGATTTLSIMYSAASPSAIIVDFDFFLLNGTRLSGTPVLLTSAVRRKDVDLASMNPNIPANQFFSIRYKVRNDAAPVTVDYTQKFAGDTMATSFTIASNSIMYFGDGFLDPAAAGVTYSEVISIFNPYTDSRVIFNFGIRFRFNDGSVISVSGPQLGPLQRYDVRPQDLPQVMTKINSGPQFRFYSVVVGTSQFVNGNQFNGAGVAQITRVHAQSSWRQTMTSEPMIDPTLPVIYMDAPQFDPL